MSSQASLLAVLTVAIVSSSAGADVLWDNNIETDSRDGRAMSPPGNPDNRVVDDIVVPAGHSWTIEGVAINVIEWPSWEHGDLLELTIYRDTDGEGPGEVLMTVTDGFSRVDIGPIYGFRDFEYRLENLNIVLEPGAYWVGLRNPEGGGERTNFWMTSDGGPDGEGSSTGFLSEDAGTTWHAEGEQWHHAFEIIGVLGPGGCVREPQWVCDGDVDGDGQVNPVDAGLVQAEFCAGEECVGDALCQYDMDCDGRINPVDSGIVQSLFGTCEDPRAVCP